MQIVASLYMARSDVAYTVRSAALHVWKTIVSNTPRTLAEILPALMRSVIESLASSGALIRVTSHQTHCRLENDADCKQGCTYSSQAHHSDLPMQVKSGSRWRAGVWVN